MADFDNRALRQVSTGAGVMDAGLRAYMLRVYNYMLVGLAITGATGWLLASEPSLQSLFYGHDNFGRPTMTMLGIFTILAQLGVGFFLIFRLNRMSVAGAQLGFWIYSALMGFTIGFVLLAYTGASVAEVFFITAGTFGAMSLWGYTTRSNLTGMGSFLLMGLIGIIIATVVNMFLHSAMMQWIISIIGVLIFTGLTAYDTQKIKETYVANDDGTVAGRKAIYGALMLYLDFINLFLYLIQLLGSQRR
jgi:FtsH-binding integral membrane protein